MRDNIAFLELKFEISMVVMQISLQLVIFPCLSSTPVRIEFLLKA